MSKREFPRLQDQHLAAPIRIVIAPTASGRKWVSSLNDKTLCISASPLVKASRLLIAERFDPNSIIEMCHRYADAWVLRGRLGAVAAVIIDGEKKPTPELKNISADTFRRIYPQLIQKISERPRGVRLGDVLDD
jgi:hypothetical protein